MTGSKKLPSVARCLTSRTTRAAGVLLLAITLAACGGSDNNASLAPVGPGGGSQPLTPVEPGGGQPLTPIGPGDNTLPLQPISPTASVTCLDSEMQPMTVQAKTVTIYNDSNQKIYPVIISGAKGVDEWLQACNRTTAKAFPVARTYKLFINDGTGMDPGSAIRVTLPLYSTLIPTQDDPDDHISWWNGGRVTLAGSIDGKHGTERLHPNDPNTPADVPIATPASVTCLAEGTSSCKLSLYETKAGEPVPPIYAQLTEFTFGTTPAPVGQTEPMLRPALVGYNISYVDQLYMPVAMEPAANPYIGYSGSVMDWPTFAGKLNSFVTDPTSAGNDWSVYNMSELRLPSTANSFVEQIGRIVAGQSDVPVQWPGSPNPPLLTVAACRTDPSSCTQDPPKVFGQAIQRLMNLWSTCVKWEPGAGAPASTDPSLSCPTDLQSKMQQVHDLLKQNWEDYQAQFSSKCTGTMPDKLKTFTYEVALERIYGWVPYNDGCAADFNPLFETVIKSGSNSGVTGKQVQPMYTEDLQYNYESAEVKSDPKLTFNPYVQLIHGDLGMSAYAFSVDDAVGFMQEAGSGLIYTVGGNHGLPNRDQFSFKDGFTVSLGVPQSVAGTNKPFIKSYGVCVYNDAKSNCGTVKQDMTMPQVEQVTGFRVGTVASYPVRVSFTDVKDNVYSFDVGAQFICPQGTDPKDCPTNKSAVYNPATCSVTDSHGVPIPGADTSWCPGTPNAARSGKNPQTIQYYINFNPPLID